MNTAVVKNKCSTGRPDLYGHLEESPSQVRRKMRRARTKLDAEKFPGTTPSLPWKPARSRKQRDGFAAFIRRVAASHYKALTCPEGLRGAFDGYGNAGRWERKPRPTAAPPTTERVKEVAHVVPKQGRIRRFMSKFASRRGG